MKNILPPLLQTEVSADKKNKTKKKLKQKKKKPQGCSIIQLPGRCWREGRAAPSDSSGGKDAQREQLNYSQGIKVLELPPCSPQRVPRAFPLLFAWLGTAPPSTQK